MQCGLILYGTEEVSLEQESFSVPVQIRWFERKSFDWPPFQRKELLITAQSFVYLGSLGLFLIFVMFLIFRIF